MNNKPKYHLFKNTSYALSGLKHVLKTEDKIKELTQMQADLIEKQIKEKPELWFWQHKRWKQFYKELYKRNK